MFSLLGTKQTHLPHYRQDQRNRGEEVGITLLVLASLDGSSNGRSSGKWAPNRRKSLQNRDFCLLDGGFPNARIVGSADVQGSLRARLLFGGEWRSLGKRDQRFYGKAKRRGP
jgi:hypothetical protein